MRFSCGLFILQHVSSSLDWEEKSRGSNNDWREYEIGAQALVLGLDASLFSFSVRSFPRVCLFLPSFRAGV